MTVIIGLTGGIGSGKSTVAAYFSALDVAIIDADKLARQVVSKGQPALMAIKKHFGGAILIDGSLNRSLLREIIFHDETQKNWLNNLLHPLIRDEIMTLLARQKGDYLLLEAPLLFENQLDVLTDYNLVVDVAADLQLQRASSRDGVTVENIKAIINSQMSRKKRLEKADFIIDNNGPSRKMLQNRVIDLDRQFRRLIKKIK